MHSRESWTIRYSCVSYVMSHTHSCVSWAISHTCSCVSYVMSHTYSCVSLCRRWCWCYIFVTHTNLCVTWLMTHTNSGWCWYHACVWHDPSAVRVCHQSCRTQIRVCHEYGASAPSATQWHTRICVWHDLWHTRTSAPSAIRVWHKSCHLHISTPSATEWLISFVCVSWLERMS